MRGAAAIAAWLTLAFLGGDADAQQQRRRHRRAEPRPDAATLRRCGEPLPQPERGPDIDPWFSPRMDGRPLAPFFRWPPGSPCDLEQTRQMRRTGRVVQAFNDSRIVNTCWQELLRVNPAVSSARVEISLAVDRRGVVTIARVARSPGPRFTACLQARGDLIAPVAAGRRTVAVVSVSLTTSG